MTTSGPRFSPLRIALLCGGNSAERAISLQSGAAVETALRCRGHGVTVIDPRETDLRTLEWSAFDVAFLALHGTFGEDGQVQRLLESAGVPFTGSGSQASRLSFSKSAAKERFFQFNVPTPHAVLVHETDTAGDIDRRVQTVGFPLVVKPDAQGSSLGVSIVRDAAELPAALSACFHFHPFGLLEEFVAGEEWTVALIDDEVLPPIRIRPAAAFFDFQAKYEDERTRYELDADVPPEVLDSIRSSARRACAAVGTRGAARVDLILDAQGKLWVLEVNTIPGMTSHSLLPRAAARAGMSFEELCETLARRALQSARRRAA